MARRVSSCVFARFIARVVYWLDDGSGDFEVVAVCVRSEDLGRFDGIYAMFYQAHVA